MYVRPQGYRYPEGVRLPKNYGGCAFSERSEINEDTAAAPNAEVTDPAVEHTASPKENDSTEALLPREERKYSPPSGIRSIGSEELLLFALILLLSDSDIGDDLVLFLILLFFIK